MKITRQDIIRYRKHYRKELHPQEWHNEHQKNLDKYCNISFAEYTGAKTYKEIIEAVKNYD